MNGASLIAKERKRQILEEGWTPEHDNEHDEMELTFAAISYCQHAKGDRGWNPNWPWPLKWWKPKGGKIRNLVKAGALIAAEIDRLQRLK
jgi:hypothetical protein